MHVSFTEVFFFWNGFEFYLLLFHKLFYLLTLWTHFIYDYIVSDIWWRNISKPAAATTWVILFDQQQGCFYMYHPTDRIAIRELLFPISCKGYFIMHRPTDRIAHNTAFNTPVVEHWLERNGCTMGGGGIDPNTHRTISGRCHEDTSRSWLEDYPRY